MLLVEVIGIFLFILVFGYFLPAGQFYYKYHLRPDPSHELHPIQSRRPTRSGIWREVRLSVVTIAIFAALATLLLELWKADKTSVYLNPHEFSLAYLPFSFVLCLVLHDTYFYWTHRFMHWRPVFPYIHLGHHRSVSPTPWAIYAFQPLEAIIQFCGIILLVVFVPLHPLVLLAFLSYDTLVNTAGHTGYELVPKAISSHWLFKPFNTVTHHDTHHTNVRVNFGSFFNIWDRIMGTFSGSSADVRKPMPRRPPLRSPESAQFVDGVRPSRALIVACGRSEQNPFTLAKN